MATRIAYLVDYVGGSQAGTERQLLQLIERLDRTRYEPELAVLRSSEYIEHHLLDCPVTVLSITTLARVQSILKMMRFARDLRRRGCQLVHCFLNDVSLIAPPVLRMFGIRALVSRRDMGFWYTPANLVVLRLVSLFVDRYVANSRAVAGIVQQRERVPGEKISVVYNGLDRAMTQSGRAARDISLPGIVGQGPVVGIVANLKPLKRIDVLIEAMARVCKHIPSASLVVVGSDGPSARGESLRMELEKLADRLGIRDKVVFTGGVDDPVSYIDRFSVAVLCSESEGFSNAVMEYMRAARPIVCTDTGGNPELVKDGTNGFLVPVGDATALADRVIALLSDEVLARRLGAAARETVTSMYSCDRMVMEQMACYDEVLAGTPSGSISHGKSASRGWH
jgi:glycosyltransferase involved in cell wall biosynthesis